MFSRANRLGRYCIVFCITAATFVGVVSPTLLADPQFKAPETKLFLNDRHMGHCVVMETEYPLMKKHGTSLKKSNFETLTLIDPQGRVKIVDLFGVDVAPCGRVEGRKIIGNCRLKGVDLLNHNSISIFVVIESGKDPKKCRVNDELIDC